MNHRLHTTHSTNWNKSLETMYIFLILEITLWRRFLLRTALLFWLLVRNGLHPLFFLFKSIKFNASWSFFNNKEMILSTTSEIQRFQLNLTSFPIYSTPRLVIGVNTNGFILLSKRISYFYILDKCDRYNLLSTIFLLDLNFWQFFIFLVPRHLSNENSINDLLFLRFVNYISSSLRPISCFLGKLKLDSYL